MEQIELRYEQANLTPERLQLGGRTVAEHVPLSSAAAYGFSLTGQQGYLAVHDLVFEDGEMRVGGGAPIRGRDLRRTLTYVPAGVTVEGWCKPEVRRQSFTAIYFDEGELPDDLRRLLSEPSVYFHSLEVERVMQRIAGILRRPAPFGDLLNEQLCQLAVVELANHLGVVRQQSVRSKGLSERDIRAVHAYVADNLHADLTLNDLAAVVGLSRFHFLRAYRTATGTTPYRAVLEFRLESALARLRSGEGPEAAARLTGFRNAQAMSRAFSRLRGRPISALLR